MNLKDIAKKPKLVTVVLEDAETVKEFGEPLEFYTWDRTPIHQFLKLASVREDNYQSIMDAVKDLIMDEKGDPILNDDTSLPNHVLMKVITTVVQGLGKSQK